MHIVYFLKPIIHSKMAQKQDIYDNPPCRRGTDCIKYDSLRENYGSDNLIPLWVADMDYPVAQEITDALRAKMIDPVFGYHKVPDRFWQSILDWISKNYGFTPERKELTYIPGIVRGIGFAINFFTHPGDRILIFSPVYHPFKILTEGNGRVCVEVPLATDAETGRFGIDFALFEEYVRNERPKMMVLCNPHNPGGRQWQPEELERVAEIAVRYGVIVISDEIHGDLMLDGKKHYSYFSAGENAEKTGIMFGAPSKTFNIPGLVSSWIVIRNPELREKFYSWLEVNEFSVPAFFATAATEAAYRHGEHWLACTLEYIEGNMTFLEKRLEDINGIRAIRPDASYLVWLDCRGLGLGQADLEDLFVRKAGLALNSGTVFGKEGEGFMRLNVALSRKELGIALDRLEAAVKETGRKI